MKAILMSVHAKWCAKIMNGDKTVEIRKTMPKCELPIDVYIYMTKNGGELFNGLYTAPDMNGRVIAKFTMKKCQEWHNYSWQTITECGCVSDDELRKYCEGHKSLYIWHISNLVIFDKPKELSEFYKPYADKCLVLDDTIEDIKKDNFYRGDYFDLRITKAPQSWQFIEV